MRATLENVKLLIKTTISDETIIKIIGQSNKLVDNNLLNKNIDNDTLTIIEELLVCHFISNYDNNNLIRKKIGDAENEYASIITGGLKTTAYGQSAISHDTSGTLATLGLNKARFDVL